MNLTTLELLQQIRDWVVQDQMPTKEDVIDDLATIRAGAAAGGTAYQKPQMGVPNSDLAGNIVASKLAGDIPASKLAAAVQALLTAASTALQPSDLNSLNSRVSALESLINPGGTVDPDDVINKFNEIVDFLAGIPETTLSEILAGISQELAAKYVKPGTGIPKTDLASGVQESLDAADTAVQYEETEGTDDQDLIDEYSRVLGALYQALANVESEKADYVGSDNYVYHFNRQTQQYQRTNLYVKGDPGTTDYNQLLNKPNLKQVATTGDYNDLINKPSLDFLPSDGGIIEGGNLSVVDGEFSVIRMDDNVTIRRGKVILANSDGNVSLGVTSVDRCLEVDANGIEINGTSVATLEDIPDELKDLTEDSTHRTVSDTEKQTWNGKYAKPQGGIPESDCDFSVMEWEENDDPCSLLS